MGFVKGKQSLFRFVEGNYNLLMIFLILLYIFRPYDHGLLYNSIWKLFFIGANVFPIFIRQKRKLARTVILLLAAPSVLLSWGMVWGDPVWEVAVLCIASIIFLLVCAIYILRDVMVKARVTLETLRGVVCVYFILAFLFGYFFTLIETILPGSILIRGEVIPVIPKVSLYFGEMLYFSFGTLLTIGFGDIVAAKNFSQSVAVIEGIVGQLYVVMLLGRFVSGYSSVPEIDKK